jgi:molybdopterin converting factor small subunit
VDVFEVAGASVGEVLNGLKEKASGIETRLFKGPNVLNRFVNVYLNDEDIRFLKNLDTPVKAGDELSIVPAIAGGSATHEVSGSITLRVPSMMRPFCKGESSFTLRPGTISNVLEQFSNLCDGLRERLWKSDNRRNPTLAVYINDEDIRFIGGVSAVVKPGDEVSIVSNVCGG